MVKYKTILKIIEEEIVKCSNEELERRIRKKTEGLSVKESYNFLFEELKKKDCLNTLEEDDYLWKKNRFLELSDNLINLTIDEKQEYEELIYDLFQYNKRLVTSYKKPSEPNIDLSSYKSDNKVTINQVNEPMGAMETAQVEAQQKAMNLNTLENKDKKNAIDCYFNGDCHHINRNIDNKKYLKKLDNQLQKEIKDIDSIMEKSTGLLEDTILFRGGVPWNIHWNVGDHVKGFKGYQSASFQFKSAERYQNMATFSDGNWNTMLLRVHAPKGTKGICGNDTENVVNGLWEHEYVLPRNVGYTITSIDYRNRIADIVLDEP